MPKKKKTFSATTAHHPSALQQQPNSLDRSTATDRTVEFPRAGNAIVRTHFDFSRWYDVGIDEITSACQQQVELFLRCPTGDRSPATIVAYCEHGLAHFLTFCKDLAVRGSGSLSISDINRELIDHFVAHLKSQPKLKSTQRMHYKNVKSVLVALGKRGVMQVIVGGDHATFPHNPFPNSNRPQQPTRPLSEAQRKAFSQAVKTAVLPLLRDQTEPTSELLGYALLVIALHTGRNTTPLLELTIDCLKPHPKEHVKFLVLYKRRSRSYQQVPVRDGRLVSDMPAVQPNVIRLIEKVIELTAPFRADAPDYLSDRLWIYRSQRTARTTQQGQVIALTNGTLEIAIKKLVSTYKLEGDDGKPLNLSVSALRKSFGNRVLDILQGDIETTAVAMGNTPRVLTGHYMTPDDAAVRNWRFMGQTMTLELLSGSIGTTAITPSGRCADPVTGTFAPKNGALCISFLDCLRCRSYVVTGDDLHRLMSLYWLVARERDRVDKKKWKQRYAHILRLIDRDVLDAGVARNVFTARQIAEARSLARRSPHPFWADRTRLEDLA